MRRRSGWVVAASCCLATGVSAQMPGTEGPSLQAFLFGDAIFTVVEGPGEDGFHLGQMVAHGNATLSQRVVFFGELSITGRNSGYALAMERAILRYDFSDAVKVSAGRYHTPVSYWNTEFHHGLWLQASVARPEAIKFGSRYVPVHFVGAMVEGNLHAAPIYYAVGVGNGRGVNIAGAGDGGDANDHRAVIASVSVRPRSLFGFRVGGAVYLDRISDAVGELADERIVSAHVVWDRGSVEASAEYIDVVHEAVGTDVSTGSPSYYVHLGVRLSGALQQFTPYGRFEKMDIDGADVVFTGQLTDYEAVVLGLRYDFDDFAALKAEYRGQKLGTAPRGDAYFVQASFAIPVSGGS